MLCLWGLSKLTEFEAKYLDRITRSGAAAGFVGAMGGLGQFLVYGDDISAASNFSTLAASFGISSIVFLGSARRIPILTIAGVMGGVASVFALAAGITARVPAPADQAAAVTVEHSSTLHPAPPLAVKSGSLAPLPPLNP